MKKLSRVFRDRSINGKFLMISYSLIILSFLFFIVASIVMLFSHTDELLKESSKTIRLVTNIVDNQLQAVDEISYNIISDDNVQSSLKILNTTSSEYEKFLQNNTISNRKSTYIDNLQIKDVTVVANNFSDTAQISSYLSSDEMSTMLMTLPDKPSKGRWFMLDETNMLGVYAKNIFSYQNLELDKIGSVFIVVDFNFIKEILSPNIEADQYTFLALIDELPILITNLDSISPDNQTAFIEQITSTDLANGQSLITPFNDSKFISTKSVSASTGAEFYYSIPRNDVMIKVFSKQLPIFLIMILTYSGMVMLSKRYIKKITRPIEKLSNQMKKLKGNDFSEAKDFEIEVYESEDELGQLYASFKSLLHHLEWLIRKNYQKKILVQEIEFKALQSQINPHFLYNTLDSINWLAKMKGQKEISEMVESLAFLFRKLTNNQESIITLQEELDIVESYITIQKIRFKEKLDFISIVSVDASEIRIPKLIIQPLIENAVNYAVEPASHTCVIQLLVQKKDNKIIIKVVDNGPGFTGSGEKIRANKTGIGIQNIDKRIKLQYGNEFGITIDSVPDIRTEVCVTIPV